MYFDKTRQKLTLDVKPKIVLMGNRGEKSWAQTLAEVNPFSRSSSLWRWGEGDEQGRRGDEPFLPPVSPESVPQSWDPQAPGQTEDDNDDDVFVETYGLASDQSAIGDSASTDAGSLFDAVEMSDI